MLGDVSSKLYFRKINDFSTCVLFFCNQMSFFVYFLFAFLVFLLYQDAIFEPTTNRSTLPKANLCSMVVYKAIDVDSLHNLNSYLHTNSGLRPCSIHFSTILKLWWNEMRFCLCWRCHRTNGAYNRNRTK